MRNYTDSCGQQWVDNGMGWVPAQTALWGGGLGSYGNDFAYGKGKGNGCGDSAARRGDDPRSSCYGCCLLDATLAAEEGRNSDAVYQGCMYTCAAGADQQGRRQRPQSPRFRGRGAAAAAVESSSASGAALMGDDGRWYAPDGLGGTLVWNGAGWCRQ
jgi:hypothetical protein